MITSHGFTVLVVAQSLFIAGSYIHQHDGFMEWSAIGLLTLSMVSCKALRVQQR